MFRLCCRGRRRWFSWCGKQLRFHRTATLGDELRGGLRLTAKASEVAIQLDRRKPHVRQHEERVHGMTCIRQKTEQMGCERATSMPEDAGDMNESRQPDNKVVDIPVLDQENLHASEVPRCEGEQNRF